MGLTMPLRCWEARRMLENSPLSGVDVIRVLNGRFGVNVAQYQGMGEMCYLQKGYGLLAQSGEWFLPGGHNCRRQGDKDACQDDDGRQNCDIEKGYYDRTINKHKQGESCHGACKAHQAANDGYDKYLKQKLQKNVFSGSSVDFPDANLESSLHN